MALVVLTAIPLLLILTTASFANVSADEYHNSSDGCPIWHYLHRGECECRPNLHWIILCSRDKVNLRVDYGMSVWNNSTVIASARYTYHNYSAITPQLRVYLPVPGDTPPDKLNQLMCSGNYREGFFCSKCISNYGPSAYSPKCYKCDRSLPSALALSLAIQFLPVTAMFLLIATFRINLTKGPMLGYIFYCQMNIIGVREAAQFNETLLIHSRIPLELTHILCSIWSLDFLQLSGLVRPFCISSNLSDLDVLFLHYLLSVLFPLLLAVVILILIKLHALNCRVLVVCWKPFHTCSARARRNLSASDSAIHGFASLTLLSFMLINYNTNELLRTTNVYSASSDPSVTTTIVYSDPSVQHHSRKYICYLTTVITILFIFGAIPSLLLLLYPMRRFRRKLEQCVSRKYLFGVTTFVNTFQDPFKDGSDGTRDYRIIPGLITTLIMLFTIVSCFENTKGNGNYFIIVLMVCSGLLGITCAYICPFKHSSANKSVTFHFLWTTLTNALLVLWEHVLSMNTTVIAIAFAVTVPVPHVVMFLWLCYKLWKKLQMRLKGRLCFRFAFGKSVSMKQFTSSLLPDRLLNSKDYQ